MSKKQKTGFPEDRWVAEYIDRMNPAEGHTSTEMSRDEAEVRYAELTEQGTKKTNQDKNCLGFYRLRKVW